MAEYIEREAVIADLKEQVEKGRDTAECEATELVIQRFAEYIRVFPASDVQPVKRGKWHRINNEGFIYCSKCHKEAYWDTDYGQQLFDYCPYCGAKMSTE